MSTGHENVVWQSPDGTWSRGFYRADRYYPDDDSEPEITYDLGEFEWVSTGHQTEQEASASWRGANPGHSNVIALPTSDDAREHWGEESERLDDLAGKLWADPAMRYMCHGRPKQRSPRFLARDIAHALVHNAYVRLGGYANLPTDVSAETAELRSRLPELNGEQRTAVAAELTAGALKIQNHIEQNTSWRRTYADAVSEARKLGESLTNLTAEFQPAATAPTASPARAKTTPNSTAGSFAPKAHSAPDVTLGPAPGT